MKRNRDHNANDNCDKASQEGGSEVGDDSLTEDAKKRKKGTRVSGSYVYEEFKEKEGDSSRVICNHCSYDLMIG